jgi:hypothetical protein
MLSSVLTNLKNISPLIRYVQSTQRFPLFIDYYDDTSSFRAQPP